METLDRCAGGIDRRFQAPPWIKWWSLISPRRAPTPPKTWSRSRATDRPWCCDSASSAPARAGARLAEPGEFTLRAYLNGRIDLPQAEAVRDLIEATTLYQARVAAQQVEGSVSKRIRPIKEQLVELIALLEAGIDFAEDDISVAPAEEILRRLNPIEQALAALAATFDYGKLVHSGITLAIVGRPNVGKSSLFNRLLEQDRAIVTDIPGTTRDLVSEVAAIDGIPVKFVDTAGIRSGQDLVETLGIERSYQAMADADVTLVVVDLSAPIHAGRSGADRTRASSKAAGFWWETKPTCRAWPSRRRISSPSPRSPAKGSSVCAKQIAPAWPRASRTPDSSPASGTSSCCAKASKRWQQARKAAEFGIPHEMLLLDLYAALRPIDAITGATTADDILNRIFSTFCIGK